jgi:enediyne biosynthesis protein E4
MTVSRREFVGNTAKLLAFSAFPRQLSAAEVSGIRFSNGAAQSGLDFVLRNGASGHKYQVEAMAGGLAVIDYDGDGWPDLYCVNGAALPSLVKTGPEYWNRLFRNNRDGTFTDVTEKAGLQGLGYGIGAAVADYDHDGHEDLLVVGVHGITLYRNSGDGTFTDVTRKAGLAEESTEHPLWPVAAAWIDYDNDGHLDLFVSNYCDWTAGADPFCAGLGSEPRSYCHPDLYHPEPMRLFHNRGDGTFTQESAHAFPASQGKGMGIALADFARDGRLGIFVANDNAPNLLFRNRKGRFEETGLDAGVAYNAAGRAISGMGADFGDIDGDGLPDVVVTGLVNEGWEVFLNQGSGNFVDGSAATGALMLSRSHSGWGCGLADFDNDGWLDWFTAGGGLDHGQEEGNRLFRNTGGRFTDISEAAGLLAGPARLHRGVVFADFDRDGLMDAAVTALNAPIELWWNRSQPRHWLQLRLEGRQTNRSAIGAVLICKAGGRTQSRCVANSMGYGSSGDLTIHFGLGDAAKAELEVRWPSGVRQALGEVAADQKLHVLEPTTRSATAG